MIVRKKLVFVIGDPFQPSLMVASKAGAYPTEALSGVPLKVGFWPFPQTLNYAVWTCQR
jgi:hypothetical protein